MNQLLKIEDVAKILQVHERTVRRWEKAGLLKATRFGEGTTKPRLRFTEEAVQAFVEGNHEQK